MRLLLYGGTFDPPHNGHLNNLRAAAARVRPDRVVVMPAGLSPFKQSTAAPGSARVEMCACFRALEAEGAVPALCVSGWEVEQAALGRRNYTVLTLEMLARTYPEAELYMAMGSDMLLSFDSWHRWQEAGPAGGHEPECGRRAGASRQGKADGPHRGPHPVCTGRGSAHGQQQPACPPCSRGSV
jgi:cytidyltransferase-like protein